MVPTPCAISAATVASAVVMDSMCDASWLKARVCRSQAFCRGGRRSRPGYLACAGGSGATGRHAGARLDKGGAACALAPLSAFRPPKGLTIHAPLSLPYLRRPPRERHRSGGGPFRLGPPPP